MDRCVNQPGWQAYFKENMGDMGLPTPQGIYTGAAATVATWKSIADVVTKVGPRLTVREAAGAATQGEVLTIAGGMAASWYVGGVIGSMAVATGRHLACGVRMIDGIAYAQARYPSASWLVRHFQRHPEIFDYANRNRRAYAAAARMRA